MASILVIDDEENIRDLIATSLAHNGYEIFKLSDSREVSSFLETHHIDLLITDLVMPGKNGLDIIIELRSSHPSLKILAISGGGGITGRFDYLPIAEMSGADFILRKPFKLDELGDVVKNLLASK